MSDHAGASTAEQGKRTKRAKPDWAAQLADRVLRRHERRTGAGGDRPVVIASGMSPSGPIHLGNLRELMVPHFVAEEIRGRGIACDHLLSWDDYDRLRKVPAGVPSSIAEHIGRPLSSVPDPYGELSSYAERFKAPLRRAMHQLGVAVREISQTEMYRNGAYRDEIIQAIDARRSINEVLDRFRTLEVQAEPRDTGPDDGERVLEPGGAEDDPGPAETSGDYWPYKVYCQTCGRDLTEIESAAPGEGTYPIEYRCTACGHHGRFDLFVENHGKLVWKVDWPMRWAHEGVTFEAGGADHSSPGSSFSVGSELVTSVFGGEPPEYEAYSFVGIKGMGKLSSSAGAVPTPADALGVLEAPILRWMYVRKTPRQGITVDLGSGIHALYDEWDALSRKVESGEATPAQVVTYDRARRSSSRAALDRPTIVVPFRT
ncbi:MAG: lysine--tRNA ligase, partial [Acidimicrobiia bacterium]|nr:lysine--tRNA ligase [Acidimicrobiia bacterium]